MKRLLILFAFILSVIFLTKGQSTFQNSIINPIGEDYATGILETDSGYIVCADGYESDINNWHAIKFYRVNSTGDVTDYEFIGKQGYGFWSSPLAAFHKVGNNEYIVAGQRSDSAETESKALLIKLNADLDTLWMREYGRPSRYTYAYQVRQTPDGGYVLFGSTNAYDRKDYYLIRTDSSGHVLWEKTYGGGQLDKGLCMNVNDKNEYLLSGASESFSLEQKGYYLKVDSTGTPIFDKTYGTDGKDAAAKLTMLEDGGFLLWGGLDTVVNNTQTRWAEFIAKFDTSGDLVWRTFISKQDYHKIRQVRELEDGSIVFTGQAISDSTNKDAGWIGKLNAKGNILWERIHTYNKNLHHFKKNAIFRYDFKPTSDGGFIVTGNIWRQRDTTQPSVNTHHIWLVKLDSMGCLKENCSPDVGIDKNQSITTNEGTTVIYPNPFSQSALVSVRAINYSHETVKFRLYSIKGELLRQQMHELNSAGYGEWPLQRNDLSKGVYIYQVTRGGAKIGHGKVVVE